MSGAPKGNGGGVSTSPHLPGSNPIAGEGNLLFPGRIRIRLKILRSQEPVPSRVSNQALLPRRSPASLRPKHLCLVEASFAFPSPEGSGSAGRSGKWERLWLAPLPHASSSLALPVPLSPVDPCGCPRLSVSGSSFELSFRFREGRSGYRHKLDPPAESRNGKLPVDN